jgi:hypothetical protein
LHYLLHLLALPRTPSRVEALGACVDTVGAGRNDFVALNLTRPTPNAGVLMKYGHRRCCCWLRCCWPWDDERVGGKHIGSGSLSSAVLRNRSTRRMRLCTTLLYPPKGYGYRAVPTQGSKGTAGGPLQASGRSWKQDSLRRSPQS